MLYAENISKTGDQFGKPDKNGYYAGFAPAGYDEEAVYAKTQADRAAVAASSPSYAPPPPAPAPSAAVFGATATGSPPPSPAPAPASYGGAAFGAGPQGAPGYQPPAPAQAPSPTPAPAPGGASFGGSPITGTPAPAPASNPMGTVLRGLDWSAANAGNATAQMYDLMQRNGWTAEQVGAELGFTGDQIRAHLAKYGIGGTSGRPTFNLASAPTQGPTNWDVSGNQTVANQLSTLLAADSPLMQQARTRALQQANARGLANSSMAVSAGEAAMYDAALPIAQADAATYGSAAQFNAGAQNTFTRDSNQFSRDGAMANFNLAANDWAADRDLDRDVFRDDINTANNADTAGTAEEATLKRGYINAINQARTDYTEKLAAVSSSSTMSTELKAETMANLKASYNTIIQNYARMLGWDEKSWLIGTDPTDPNAPAPAPGAPPQPYEPGWVNPDYGGAGSGSGD